MVKSLATATTVILGLSVETAIALGGLPFDAPWRGPDRALPNVGISVTRASVSALLRYFSSLSTEEFRVAEQILDAACNLVMPPVVALHGVETEAASLGGVQGWWYRPRRSPDRGTILYFHGGGYVGTTPMMYASFIALLARRSGCDVFIADYRLAPEFPFPAAINDAIAVLKAALESGVPPSRLFVAGDSAGGGLVTALMCATEMERLPTVAGLILLSPEVDLRLDKPSMVDNAALDILPPDVPSTAYLQGVDPGERCVSVIEHEVRRWPPTLISFGANEMFRDSIRLLVRRLGDGNVDTTAIEEPGMFHVFPILVPWSAAGRRAFDAVEVFTADILRGGRS
jgi:acetyl esterase/lipase